MSTHDCRKFFHIESRTFLVFSGENQVIFNITENMRFITGNKKSHAFKIYPSKSKCTTNDTQGTLGVGGKIPALGRVSC